MAVDEIVDIDRTRFKRRRQLARRIGVPVLAVVLVIASILGISFYSFESNRAGALVLSRDLLHGLQERIAHEVSLYLSPATQAALIARDMVARHAVGDGEEALQGFAASMLNQVPQLQAFYAANSGGDFIMVSRGANGGTSTKLILNPPGARQVSVVGMDQTGKILSHDVLPNDRFDPRTRAWYKGALASKAVFWSEPYIFYSSHAPGISASIRLLQSGTAKRVFGVDITLQALSGFLARLHIGKTGRAAIVERDGTVIAAANMIALTKSNSNAAIDATTADLHDPALTAAFDRFRVEGFGNRTLTVKGRRYVTIASQLPAAAQDWVLLIAAPESDFTAFAQANTRQHLLLSLITVALAAAMGGLLVRQNRRGDRLARLLAQSREADLNQSRALEALAAQPDLFDRGRPAPLLTENLAALTQAGRAGIWRLRGAGRILSCDDQFDPKQHDHVEGMQLSQSELPNFFEALAGGVAMTVADAAADPRTAELHRLVMRPFGSRAVSVVPIRNGENVAGAVLVEDAADTPRAHHFTHMVAAISAIRIGAEAESRQTADTGADTPGAPGAAAEGMQPFSSGLIDEDAAPAGLAARYFPSVAAMIVRFDDANSLARPDPAGTAAIADALAQALQAIGARFALPYMKLTGHHVVAAAGCTASPDPGALMRLADAALAARERCLALLAQSGVDPVFRIGIDFASALGAGLGEQPRLFNLWGDAIRTAELMAQSAPDAGNIQVSEGAYQPLREHFLFRARGRFYVPGAGTARTFILAGRR
ncbi:adenylate/guanylate cyclase domain-containing protein [Lichenicoccus sp.]|uniref:adenylate/guanylate cyclase domain-containing protein n=1 Tax=Lichenicoccus sp. TaxID=2781899 RepID=UPI003D1150B7